jgi:phosphate transport system substrate-binding protein
MKMGGQLALILAGIILTVISGTSQPEAKETGIRVCVATTFVELIQDLGQKFMKEHPDVPVKILCKTSEFGFEALMNKETDLVMAARKPNAVERRLAERKRVEWKGVRIAWENVAVISHSDASVGELTVDQLRKIYTGEYKNWRDLGGPDLPIVPHSLPYPQDDIAVWFADNVLSKAEFTSGIIWVKTPDFLTQHVGVHPGGVAYLGEIQLTEVLKRKPQSKIKVLSLRASADSPALSPSSEISKKGDYPLVVPVFLFWNANNPNKWIAQFAQFCVERLGKPEHTTLSE